MSYPFSTEDVLDLMRVKSRPRGNERVCLCLRSDCGDKSGHLYINSLTGQAECKKCGWQGNVITLYAGHMNMTNKQAYKDIMMSLGYWESPDSKESEEEKKKREELIRKKTEERKKAAEEAIRPIQEIGKRSKVYNSLLDKLELTEEHKRHLIQDRGFDEGTVLLKKYRSTISNKERLKKITEEIRCEGLDIEGVPGFYKDLTENWTFCSLRSGILVPVYNCHGQISGLQHRIDKVELEKLEKDGKKQAKYRWVSSAGLDYSIPDNRGVGASADFHYACDFIYKDGELVPEPREIKIKGKKYIAMGFTEGPMKADLTYSCTEIPCVAAPGVNAMKDLDNFIEIAKKQNVKVILLAYDQDYQTNPHVKKAMDRLSDRILDEGFIKYQCRWNSDYKGIDDYEAVKARRLPRKKKKKSDS
ncbi:hypothetical protein M2146_001060 [Lachnospiraceae bacterium PF1-22]